LRCTVWESLGLKLGSPELENNCHYIC
jgi:hypothetical protein